MAIEHARKQNSVGNDIVIVEVGGAGGGGFYNPAYIRCAEIEHGTEYTKISAKNVIRDISVHEFNSRGGRGPRSRYASCLAAAHDDFRNAVSKKKRVFVIWCVRHRKHTQRLCLKNRNNLCMGVLVIWF